MSFELAVSPPTSTIEVLAYRWYASQRMIAFQFHFQLKSTAPPTEIAVRTVNHKFKSGSVEHNLLFHNILIEAEGLRDSYPPGLTLATCTADASTNTIRVAATSGVFVSPVFYHIYERPLVDYVDLPCVVTAATSNVKLRREPIVFFLENVSHRVYGGCQVSFENGRRSVILYLLSSNLIRPHPFDRAHQQPYRFYNENNSCSYDTAPNGTHIEVPSSCRHRVKVLQYMLGCALQIDNQHVVTELGHIAYFTNRADGTCNLFRLVDIATLDQMASNDEACAAISNDWRKLGQEQNTFLLYQVNAGQRRFVVRKLNRAAVDCFIMSEIKQQQNV